MWKRVDVRRALSKWLTRRVETSAQDSLRLRSTTSDLGTAHFGGSKRPIWRANFCKSSVRALMYTEHREKGKYFGRNAPNEGSAYTMASKGAQDGKKSERKSLRNLT